MKKIVLVLALIALTSALAMAQQGAETAGAEDGGAAKTALSLDVFPLVKGLIWSDDDKKNVLVALAPVLEFLVAPHFSMGVGADLYAGKATDIDITYLGIAAHGRWYPLSTGLDKLFIDAGLGFNAFAVDGKTDSKKGGMMGLTISLKAGYKLLLSNLYLEPSMSYVYAKTPSSFSIPTPLGWQPGLNIGFVF